MAGKSVHASSSPSVDIQVDEMRALPGLGRSERPPLGDGYFSGELLRAASGSPVGSLGDFWNFFELAHTSTPQASTTSTSTFTVVQVAFADAVLCVNTCHRLLHYLILVCSGNSGMFIYQGGYGCP